MVVNDPAVIQRIREAANIPDPDVISIDLDDLTIDEIELLEDELNMPFDGIGKIFADPNAKKAKVLRAIALAVRRRTDPDFPAEKAGKLKISFKADPVPPTVDDGSATSPPSSSTTE